MRTLGIDYGDSRVGVAITDALGITAQGVFLADLCRAVSVPCEIGFMCAKSYYEGTVSTGVVKLVSIFFGAKRTNFTPICCNAQHISYAKR